jgi:hypothetical protein
MQPLRPDRARTLQFAAIGVSLLLLLAIVAFASRSGFGHANRSAPSPAYVSWAMSVFVIVFVLMIPVAVWAYSVQLREQRAQAETRTFQARVALRLAAVFIVFGLAYLFIHFHAKLAPQFHRPTLPGAGASRGPHAKHGATYTPTFQWPVLWATLVLFAVAGVVAWRSRERLFPPPAVGQPDATQEIVASIGEAIDDLEAEPDARRAVIAAYARMEAAFARHGLPRRVSETPVEYLRRILLGLGSRPDAVTRLTGLFEQAKFSQHRIDAALKSDAIAALRAIHADLQGSPT